METEKTSGGAWDGLHRKGENLAELAVEARRMSQRIRGEGGSAGELVAVHLQVLALRLEDVAARWSWLSEVMEVAELVDSLEASASKLEKALVAVASGKPGA